MFGPRSAKPSEPEPEPERDLTPAEDILALRYLRLLALHISPEEALSLIHIPDIGAQAEALYNRGCPPHLIVDLLKGD